MTASPLFQDLAPEEIAELSVGFIARRFRAGEALMKQGEASDGAYIVASGRVSISSSLPGGGENVIRELAPGDLVGEMALLMREGRRTASAIACSDVEAVFMDRRYFEAALNLLRPASLKVLRRLGLIVARRLIGIRASISALVDASPRSIPLRTLPLDEAHAAAPFDLRPFLPILPCFQGFSAEEIDALVALARFEDAQRGASLAEPGDASKVCRLVVRGALLLALRHGAKIHQLDVLGPGRFAGVSTILADASANAALIAAEDCVLLAFDAAQFMELLRGQGASALRLLEAVNSDLARSLATASNHLARLTAQARVRDFLGQA